MLAFYVNLSVFVFVFSFVEHKSSNRAASTFESHFLVVGQALYPASKRPRVACVSQRSKHVSGTKLMTLKHQCIFFNKTPFHFLWNFSDFVPTKAIHLKNVSCAFSTFYKPQKYGKARGDMVSFSVWAQWLCQKFSTTTSKRGGEGVEVKVWCARKFH